MQSKLLSNAETTRDSISCKRSISILNFLVALLPRVLQVKAPIIVSKNLVNLPAACAQRRELLARRLAVSLSRLLLGFAVTVALQLHSFAAKGRRIRARSILGSCLIFLATTALRWG